MKVHAALLLLLLGVLVHPMYCASSDRWNSNSITNSKPESAIKRISPQTSTNPTSTLSSIDSDKSDIVLQGSTNNEKVCNFFNLIQKYIVEKYLSLYDLNLHNIEFKIYSK